MKNKSDLKILVAAAESAPLVKIGGLGDVAGVLPKAIKALDPRHIDIRVMLPYHLILQQRQLKTELLGQFELKTLEGSLPCKLYRYQESEIPFYLISNQYIDEAPGIYSGDASQDGLKYMSFSVAILEAAKFLDWKFDVLSANDWHTAVSLHLLKAKRRTDPFFAHSKAVLTIHNMPYNGWGSQPAMKLLGIKPTWNKKLPSWARYTPLEMGIAAADKVVAVSKGYAAEILTEPFGCGVSSFIQTLGDKLTGIVNGIDTASYNPETDKHIAANYSASDLTGKLACKKDLQILAGFQLNPDSPIFSIVSRLDNQKGIGLALDAASRLLEFDWQLVLLGTGSAELEAQAAELAKAYPHKIASFIRFDDGLARKLYAGADIFLMPSLYEPCGLSQMVAMRYGNLPVAHAIGGLKDTIVDFEIDQENATGFLFDEAKVSAVQKTMKKALKIYKDQEAWQKLQLNAMQKNFSWADSAKEYLTLFRSL
ncbi:MAG: glycogen/starch synthase [Anaerolineaceae bacterium]|nr:glycogen/starch synthase [Anaerolineaceae bacterium]